MFERDNVLKRSNSARHPQVLNLTASKTKQFCETSVVFELDNIQNEAILRDFFNQKQSNFEHDNIKNKARSYEVLHLSRKNILANLQI